jgi:D-3-phosphoglycerate dehydrogenase
LAGAALDVLAGEPHISEDDPVIAYSREHSNLLIVPHIGGNTWESFARTEIFMAEQLRQAVLRESAI